MRILFVTPEYIEKGKSATGMPTYINRMAKALKNLGEEPIIVTGGSIDKEEVLDGIKVYRVKTDAYSFQNSYLNIFANCVIGNYILQKKVTEVCDRVKVDIIQYAGNNGTGLFHKEKVPAVMRVSSLYRILFQYTVNQTHSKAELNLHTFIECLALRRMNHIYCPSKLLAKELTTLVHRKVKVIEPPFYNEVTIPDPSVYYERLEGKKYLLFYGTISPNKGVLVIASMLERLLRKHPDYYMVFVGNDMVVEGQSTLREVYQLAGKAAERIIYINGISHDKLYPIIKQAEIVILPSFMENLSNACLEAMYFKKIVIGTDGTSFEQLIEEGENGFLAKVNDVDSLFEATKRAISLSDSEKRAMEEKAGERIQRLNPEQTVARLLEYYRRMIKEYHKK